MTYLKYIMFDIGGKKYPIIFPQTIQHKQISIHDVEPVSAGICMHIDGKWSVAGESVTLRLSSNKEDATIIQEDIDSANI